MERICVDRRPGALTRSERSIRTSLSVNPPATILAFRVLSRTLADRFITLAIAFNAFSLDGFMDSLLRGLEVHKSLALSTHRHTSQVCWCVSGTFHPSMGLFWFANTIF